MKYLDLCCECGNVFYNNSTWKVWQVGPVCLSCRSELEDTKQTLYQQFVTDGMSMKAASKVSQTQTENLMKKSGADKVPMKKGDLRRLPASQSPLWTDQWAAMGTGKFPYIISHKKDAAGSDIEWQCSCPAWTTSKPREDCKHILKVKLIEGVPLTMKTDTSVLLKGFGVAPVPKSSGVVTPKAGRKFR